MIYSINLVPVWRRDPKA